MISTLKARIGALAFAGTIGLAAPAAAEEISVSHWGVTMYGAPYAVAMEKGFFRQAGVDITGILTSKGGGTTVRNVLAGGLPYGEVALAAVIIAIREGIDIKIVNSGVNTVADILWVTMPNSNVKSIKDLVGKKMAITSPKGVADMLSIMVLEASGIPLDQVERPALGSIGAGLTALESGSVQAAGIIDPIWSARKDRYRALFHVKDVLPPMNQMVGITTSEFARAQPQKLRAIIAGRRMGVDYLYANPKESAQIIAKAYNLKPEVMEIAVNNLVAFRYWSRGEFDVKGMNEMVRGLKIIGEVKGEIDWDKIIDRSFLPADLRGGS
ncbi:MAG: ABC transporter substrate-binding protein [Betaproteobacteria bacterium]|nr:ABC transporter substrate-binding protein [Betaproteobacteria bacterium]